MDRLKSAPVKWIAAIVLIGAVILGATLLGSSSDTSSTSSSSVTTNSVKPDATLTVNVGEMFLKPASTKLSAGNIEFEVKNAGNMMHEVVVLKTTTPFDKLPVTNGRVSESTSVGEVADIAAGATKRNIIKLAPGSYVLVCNIAGHYSAGMRAAITVS